MGSTINIGENVQICTYAQIYTHAHIFNIFTYTYICICKIVLATLSREVGAGVETQKNVREEIGGWGRVPFNEPYAPLLSTIYDGA